MAAPNTQEITGNAEIIVDTNNFYKVLSYFNNAGELLESNARLQIDCQICMVKRLAIANIEIDIPNTDSHETYTVLPMCGHAFGTQCLQQWIRTNNDGYLIIRPASCPTCRAPISCEKGHASPISEFGSTGSKPRRQANDVRVIRSKLSNRHCDQCHEESEIARPQQAEVDRHAAERRLLEQRHAAERAQLEQRLASEQTLLAQSRDHATRQQAELHDIIQQGSRLHSLSENTWDVNARRILSIRDTIQHITNGRETNSSYWEIHYARREIELDVTRENNSRGYNAGSWARITNELVDLYAMARERVDMETRDQEFALAIRGRLDDLGDLLESRFGNRDC
ncbi:hypothetical protein F5B21DRAFT_523982 [Xylaria acuta]|nr:hypothetical protein F5B21DRAFT_523982 [Xylaria acuta]